MIKKYNIIISNEYKNYINSILKSDKCDVAFYDDFEKFINFNLDSLPYIVIIDSDDLYNNKKIIDGFIDNTQTSILVITTNNNQIAGYYCCDINNEVLFMYMIEVLCSKTDLFRQKIVNKSNKPILLNTYVEYLDIIDKLDNYTKEHSVNVMEYSRKIGQELNLDKEELSKLETAALLHDIGKVVIPNSILVSPSKLTKEQFETIKMHTTIVNDIILNDFEGIKDIIISHHEKYSGDGYPNRLKGEEIPLLSRIITVADSFDAMINQRHYNVPISISDALNVLIKDSGHHFDPKIVHVFIGIMQREL